MFQSHRFCVLSQGARPFNRLFRQSASFALIAFLFFQQLLIVNAGNLPVRQSPAESKSSSAAAVSTTLVISQFQVAGGTAADEFVELHNVSSTGVNLNGLRVVYRSSGGTTDTAVVEWTSNITVPAGGYYLIAHPTGYDGTPAANITYTSGSTGLFSGTAGGFAIRSGAANTGTIIDSVGYGSVTNGFAETAATTAPAANASKARKASGCTDTDNNSSDFETLNPSVPRNLGTTPVPCGGALAGTGSANPSTVTAGNTTLLTVAVTAGTNPASTGIAVTGNLTAIGGAASQQFFDNGTNGDQTAGDNVFSYLATVASTTAAGSKSLPVTITDAQSRSASTTIQLTVNSTSTPLSATGAANPSSVQAGNSTLLTVTVTPGTNPASTGIAVRADLTSIGGSATQAFFDDGTNGDATAGDNVFSFLATIPAGTATGAKSISAQAGDAQGRTATATISLTVTAAPVTGQTLPFSQNWTNTNLITANDNWAGVPGIVGYNGSGLTGTTGTDPQTILADGSNTAVSVFANQTDPNTLTSGGVAEFELSNPAVALQGSGTASAPHLVISLNTTGHSNITIFYNLRDLDASGDNAVQPVALQYRVGSIGNYTNIPAAFVADATTGPDEATQVTPVAAALPAAANNQQLVQLRIVTTNAVGADEWVGVDDIVVNTNGALPISGTGAASPAQVAPGNSTLLTVAVAPGSNPPSSGIAVSADLTSIGGAANQQFFDDGTNGDQTAGDNTFSYLAAIAANSSAGGRTLPVTISDAQGRTAAASISLSITGAVDPNEHLAMGNPSGAVADVNQPTNYLMNKPQYALSYHRDRAIPNWVSWRLDSSWIGSAPRQNDFRPDPALPAGWYQVQSTDYSGSGFDRGHHTPSADRTRTVADNSATFLMTNMMPQAPGNNQGPWERLESYCRTVAGQGNELYIVMGGTGTGGTGSNGGTTATLAGGKITVPAYTWKVILILPSGDNDVSRVNGNTRTIAVIMPNKDAIRPDAWQKYSATVDQVESLTGYDFFSNVPVSIQNQIEARIDPETNPGPQTISSGTYTDLDVPPNATLGGNVTVTGTLSLGGSVLTAGNNRITLAPDATVSRVSGYVVGQVEKQFNNPNAPDFEYPVGTENGYSPLTIDITALGAGTSSLTVTATQTVQPNVPDPSRALKRFWTLTEAGDLAGRLTFKYLDQDVPANVPEQNLTLRRFNGTAFEEIPATVSPQNNTVVTTNSISEFSPWTMVAPSAPTAAAVTVGGRVMTQAGNRGLGNALVYLTDQSGATRIARTNAFGYYRFEEVGVGQTYVFNVSSKRYTFAPQVVSLTEEIGNLNFTAQ